MIDSAAREFSRPRIDWRRTVPVHEPKTDDDRGGLLSHPQLAERNNLTPKQAEALRGRLARWRLFHKNGEYIEMRPSDRRPNDPTYLYKPEEVQPLIQAIKRKAALAAKRRTKTPPQRPTKS